MPPTDQTVLHIRQSMAYVEQQGFQAAYPEFHAYVGIPTAEERSTLVFPYSYRLWAGSSYGIPDVADPQQRRRPSDTGRSPRGRLHTFWVMFMLGEMATFADIAALDGSLAAIADMFDDVYRANAMLVDQDGDASCSWAKVLRAKPLQDNLLGEPHFGALFTVEVAARPLVKTSQGA